MKIAWIMFGIIIGISFYPIAIEAVEYYGKFPPTPAWQELEADDDVVLDVTSQAFVNATSYRDKLWIISDGSIDIYFTEYP